MVAGVKKKDDVEICNSSVEKTYSRNIGMVVSAAKTDFSKEGQTSQREPRVSMSQEGAVFSPPKDAVPQHLSKDDMSGDRKLYQT